jgi:hypothetical protein
MCSSYDSHNKRDVFPWTVQNKGPCTRDVMRMISGFRSEANENCTRLGYYEARRGNKLLTFRGKIVSPIVCP